MSDNKALTTRAQDFSAWYNELIARAELADYSPVRGCMVIRPNGFAIWEHMQSALDRMFKDTGVQNAYFPVFIPQSFLAKEAEHVEGFAPETAVVTHAGGKELEEPLVVRPTSETIIGAMMAKWIQSHRDLPLLLNQWCNVVRWEMRTRLFLRTTEFLWQEGHTAHATEADAEAKTLEILQIYRRFQEEYLAIPVVSGRKSEGEKFAGALRTYALEGLMQDNKALQLATSHNLGQNFAKAFDITYQTADGGLEHVWNTSWGSSTRMIGGMIMAHSDDAGFVCPPRLAQWQVVIVPIYKTDSERATVFEAATRLAAELKAQDLRVMVDTREGIKPGAKYYEWEGRGVPFRIEIGPRDLTTSSAMLARRLGGPKVSLPLAGLGGRLHGEIDAMQRNLIDAAQTRREANTLRGPKSKQEFIDYLESGGGLVYTGWCGDAAVEAEIKEATKATIRVIPDPEFRSATAPTTCIWTGKPAAAEVVFARAY
ncbi:MAG: proline--tRNA ligase [Gemmatimonadales bacterium]|nr:proline--tRNA ligase [Gemmatimonadales bacterium]